MHPYAREALEHVIMVMRSDAGNAIRLRAARMLLEFTVGKPRENRSVSLETAEWWLDQLTA